MCHKFFYCNILNNCQNNCEKIWEVINLFLNRQNFKPGCTKILHNDSTIAIKNYIAEAFNKYFTSVVVNISDEIPHTHIDFRDFLQDYNFTDTFSLPSLSPSEIKKNHFRTKFNQ